jgi:transposase
MRENDGRRLDHATLEAMRLQAVRLVAQGALPREVAAALGLNRSTVFGWLARYRDGGPEALRARSVPGRPTKLSDEAMRRLFALVVGTDPRQLRFEFGLWTRGLVQALIRREFGVGLSLASVGRMLRSLGLWSPSLLSLTPKQHGEIRAAAAAAGATVYFVREAGLITGSPADDGAARAQEASVLSVETAAGVLRFAAYEAGITASVLVDFLNRLRHDAPGPAFLVVGRHPVYRSDAVNAYVAETRGWLSIVRLDEYPQ